MTYRTPVLYLDLDGTVREGKGDALGRFVNGPEDVRVFPTAVARMTEWREQTRGRIVGVTNQGGVPLGLVSREDMLAAIQETMNQTLGLFDLVMFCDHPAGECWCRKPLPGMPIQATYILNERYPDETYPADLAVFVGDRPEDAACAKALGVRFVSADQWRIHGVG